VDKAGVLRLLATIDGLRRERDAEKQHAEAAERALEHSRSWVARLEKEVDTIRATAIEECAKVLDERAKQEGPMNALVFLSAAACLRDIDATKPGSAGGEQGGSAGGAGREDGKARFLAFAEKVGPPPTTVLASAEPPPAAPTSVIDELRNALGCDMMDVTPNDLVIRAIELRQRAERAEARVKELEADAVTCDQKDCGHTFADHDPVSGRCCTRIEDVGCGCQRFAQNPEPLV